MFIFKHGVCDELDQGDILDAVAQTCRTARGRGRRPGVCIHDLDYTDHHYEVRESGGGGIEVGRVSD